MIVLTSNSDSTYKAQRRYWEVAMIVLTRRKRLVALIASLWHNIAPYQGNNLPLPGTKRYVGSFFIKAPLFFLLFTLHQIGWNPDKHWGCERWRVTYHSSPLFTFGLRTELNRKLVLFGWGAETTFLCPTDFTDLHRFSGKRLRVKSGEEWRKLFTRASF